RRAVGGFLVRPDGPRSCDRAHDDARFFHVTEDGKSVVIGPELEGSLYSYEFAIWGDHAAAVVADEERTVDNLFYLESAIVTRFSDWKTRQVLPSPHSRVVEVALTERHLHVVESP